MNKGRNLKLVLTYKWFDMIAAGIKLEEYRTQSDYWFRRLTNLFTNEKGEWKFQHYDTVTFYRAYGKDRAEMTFAINSITEGIPRPEWSAPSMREKHFIIKLGRKF